MGCESFRRSQRRRQFSRVGEDHGPRSHGYFHCGPNATQPVECPVSMTTDGERGGKKRERESFVSVNWG